jgi:hypothetical protein
VEEDPGLMGAREVVFERPDGGKAEVEWADVRDDLTSGQWGRLIETGLLEDGETGFLIANPDAVAEVVSDDEAVREAEAAMDDDEGGWTTWDKAAALGSIGLFAGYSVGEVRDLIGGVIDVLLGPLDALGTNVKLVVLVLVLFTIGDDFARQEPSGFGLLAAFLAAIALLLGLITVVLAISTGVARGYYLLVR